jgi:hypothetical protein
MSLALRGVFVDRRGRCTAGVYVSAWRRLLIRADLGPTVFHALPFRSRVPPFTSGFLAADRVVFPSATSPQPHRHPVLHYHGIVCRPPVPSRVASPRRLGHKVSQLHRPGIGGPSSGKLVASVIAHLPSLRPGGYGKIIGLRWSTAPRPPGRLIEGSLAFR